MSEVQKRPRFRNIHVTEIVKYRLPPSGKVSILHRVSGAGMFLFLPFLLYLLDKSLTSEDTYYYMTGLTSGWFVKLILLGLTWAYLHHFCAGVRHLFMDLHLGLDKATAQKSATVVLVVSVLLTIAVAVKMFFLGAA